MTAAQLPPRVDPDFTHLCVPSTSRSLAAPRAVVRPSSVRGHISISRHSSDQPTFQKQETIGSKVSPLMQHEVLVNRNGERSVTRRA